MGIDFKEHARDSLLDRLREDGIPEPELNVDVSQDNGPGYVLDYVWREQGVTVLLGWPGRDAHNALTVAGWRVVYLEPVEAWQIHTIRLIRRALGLPLSDET